MSKFYCPKCNGTMDEVEYMEFKMCEPCYSQKLVKRKEFWFNMTFYSLLALFLFNIVWLIWVVFFIIEGSINFL